MQSLNHRLETKTITDIVNLHEDDLLKIETSLTGLTAVRVFFSYKMSNQNGELLCEGSTINCSVDAKTFKPVKFPDALAAALSDPT